MDGAEVDLGNDMPRPKKFYKTFTNPENSMSGFSTFGFSKGAQQSNWTFSLVVILLLAFVVFFLTARYIYQKYITKTLSMDSEADQQFWNKRVMGQYKNHPKIQSTL